MPRLVVTCWGDPEQWITWSGTVEAICQELAQSEQLAGAIDVTPGPAACRRAIKAATYSASCALFGWSPIYREHAEYRRLWPMRGLGARNCWKRLTKVSGADAVLHMGTLWLPLPQQLSIPQFLYVDSTWSMIATQHHRLPLRARTYAEEWERKAYAQMDLIFTHSSHTRETLLRDYRLDPRKVTVVGSGRGKLEAYCGPKRYDNGMTLFVAKGRFDQKGGHLLVEGFRRAHRKSPGLRLVIVGNTQYADEPAVECHSFVPWTDLQDLFNSSSLYAMPALYEPWGLVYLEALSCKTPLLGLNRNAFPEICGYGRYGFMVARDNPDEIAAALLEAHSDPARLERMGRDGQQFALQFSWRSTVRRMLQQASSLFV